MCLSPGSPSTPAPPPSAPNEGAVKRKRGEERQRQLNANGATDTILGGGMKNKAQPNVAKTTLGQ